ncbi:hypothetical protein SKAU_G00314410 [Synaphobranchus kaupii]|uniref:Uncharacterized protein n=1 Tax=Synaphobranchus kaupii TaxID=118154 RepID=A0A9Q1ILJ8_SYNKA|nr:hypothetical protein SKAU_G00314410 [Synaphobranchus kaupii]
MGGMDNAPFTNFPQLIKLIEKQASGANRHKERPYSARPFRFRIRARGGSLHLLTVNSARSSPRSAVTQEKGDNCNLVTRVKREHPLN